MTDLKEFVLEVLQKDGLNKFTPDINIREDINRCEIILEDVSYYGEWIKGEAGDIALYRAIDDDRIVGAFLPYNP